MNGYDEFGNLQEPELPASEEGFFSSALNRVQSFIQPLQRFSTSPVGSQIMSAIYNYGAGRIDAAREKYVGAFLMTSEGRKAQQEAARQTATQYFPAIILGVAILILGTVFLARR